MPIRRNPESPAGARPARAAGPPDALRERVEALPREPGVYLFRDRAGKVVYVGKAGDLRERVRGYFAARGDDRPFVRTLGRVAGDVEAIVTRNEKEALLLENNLIKLHRPRFNVLLRDDKSYIVLRIDPAQEWPRVEVVRRIAQDGARYFGPYHSATSARATLRTVERHFQLRTCPDSVLYHRRRPCLQYFIRRCPAPCVHPVDREAYAEQVRGAALFLRGRGEDLIERLRARMREHAGREEYEQAAAARDRLAAIERSLQGQRVVLAEAVDIDAFGLHREGETAQAAVLHVRQGKLLGRRAFDLRRQRAGDGDVIGQLVARYYDAGEPIPDEVLLPVPPEGVAAAAIAEWLSERAGRRVRVSVPRRGARADLCDLARRNAEAALAAARDREADRAGALDRLAERLGLRRPPRLIECYDISHLHGLCTVGSLVAIEDGEPAPHRTRHFKVRAVAGPDDYASIYEVLSRRLRRAREGDARWELPDLMVIDGGKGQLSAALAALRDSGLARDAVEMVALAKDPDRVFLPEAKDPIVLRPNTAELFVLALARDHAHRTALRFHDRLRRRRALRSRLDEAEGVGPARRRALLSRFGSLRALRAAPAEALAEVPGMTRAAAEAVRRVLGAGG